MNNQLTTQDIQQIGETLQEFARAVFDEFAEFFQGITESFRAIYKANGSPYGDTEEGFTLWLEMLNKTLDKSPAHLKGVDRPRQTTKRIAK